MIEGNKLCPRRGEEANLLPAGTHKQDDATWVELGNAERRGVINAPTRNALEFSVPSVGTYNADPKFGLKRLDEAKRASADSCE
jgi:hypothetical protein